METLKDEYEDAQTNFTSDECTENDESKCHNDNKINNSLIINNVSFDNKQETLKFPVVSTLNYDPSQTIQSQQNNNSNYNAVSEVFDSHGTNTFTRTKNSSIIDTDEPDNFAQSVVSPSGDSVVKETDLIWKTTDMNDSLELTKPSEDQSELKKLIQQKDDEIIQLKKTKEEILTILKLYEADFIQLIRDQELFQNYKKDKIASLNEEKDLALQDLDSVHKALYDLHRRHENSKCILESQKKNEETLKENLQAYINHQKTLEIKFINFKKIAESKLNQAKLEIEDLHKSSSEEIEMLKVSVKRNDVQIKSLEKQLDQKLKENLELSKICDELLGKRQMSS